MLIRFKNLYNGLDHHMQEVVNGATIAFLLKVPATVLAFMLNVALARLLGPDGAGMYFLALTVMTIGSVLGRVGLDNAMLRYVASRAAIHDWDAVKGVYAQGLTIAVAASAGVAIAIFFISPWLAEKVFSLPELSLFIRWMALAIVPTSLFTLHAEMLKGVKRIGAATAIIGIFVPAVSLAAVLLFVPSMGVLGAVGAYILASIVTAFLGVLLWRRGAPHLKDAHGSFKKAALLRTSIPMYTAALMQLVIQWTSILVLGAMGASGDVGIFGAASRTAMLTSFILIAVNSIAAPKFASLYEQGDMKALEQTARSSARLMTLLASPLLLLFLAAPRWVMGIFGKGFIEGAPLLAVLAIGQFVNVATGSVGYLLLMSGNEKTMQYNLTVCALINLILCIGIIPRYGAMGAAVATAVTVSLQNVMAAQFVKRKLGIATLPF